MKPILLLLILCLAATVVKAQPAENWDQTKLMGQRLIHTDHLRGSPFLFDDWIDGDVVLTNGDVLTGIPLKYDAYRDELLTYNKVYFTVLKIEKATVKSFHFVNMGQDWYFEQRYFDGLLKGDRFFRVLYDGDVDLLQLFKTEKVNTSVYKDESGVSKNEEFVPVQRYFMYSEKAGFSPVSLRKKSLMRRIGKDDLKLARQLVRQNNIAFGSAAEFVRALALLQTNSIQLHF